MSYLLDALSKAERERQRDQVPQLTATYADTTMQRPRRARHWLAVLVFIVLALNLLAMVYVWKSMQAPELGVTPPAVAAITPRVGPVEKPARQVQRAAASPALPNPVHRSVVKPAVPAGVSAPVKQQSQQVNVTTSDAPGDLSRHVLPVPRYNSGSGDVPDYNELAPAQRRQVPRLSIKGLLYSTAPGRSFVIVNGQRYREGERTAAGPAIVVIEKDGVVLDQHGIRYRLPSP